MSPAHPCPRSFSSTELRRASPGSATAQINGGSGLSTCGKLEPAEIFREVLEHRWFLSEAAGKDVGSLPAARSYVRDVLAHKPDELTVLDAPTGGMAVQHP